MKYEVPSLQSSANRVIFIFEWVCGIRYSVCSICELSFMCSRVWWFYFGTLRLFEGGRNVLSVGLTPTLNSEGVWCCVTSSSIVYFAIDDCSKFRKSVIHLVPTHDGIIVIQSSQSVVHPLLPTATKFHIANHSGDIFLCDATSKFLSFGNKTS